MSRHPLITCILIIIFQILVLLPASGQFTTPTVDANFDGAPNYTNSYTSGTTTWSLTWNNTDLFVFIQNANQTEAVSIFLDVDPINPVNGGANTDGTLVGINYDGYSTLPNLPFRADVLIYAHNGYREVFRRDGANGWTSIGSGTDGIRDDGTDDYTSGNANGQYASHDNGNGNGGDDRREFRISWSRLQGTINGGNRPAAFNWLGYISYSNGMYAQVPAENYNGADVNSNSNGIVRYFTVSSTEDGTSTAPFSRNSYSHPPGIDNTSFGAINIWDFTMNSSGRTITRTSGEWNISGNLVIAAGTLDLGSTVTNDVNIAGNFLKTAGTFTSLTNGILNFNGTGAQSYTNNVTNSYRKFKVSNTSTLTLQRAIGITGATSSFLQVSISANLIITNTVTLNLLSISAIDGTLASINSGNISGSGSLSFSATGQYHHQRNDGAIPTATWNAASTCLITGITSGITVSSFNNQTFGNFTWNCAGQTASVLLSGGFPLTTAGAFTLNNTGSGNFRLSAGGVGTINCASYLQTGGSLIMGDGTGTGTINCPGGFSQTGGTISETSSGNRVINFTGSVGQSINLPTPGNFSGNINFRVNNSAGITITGSLPINGDAASNGATFFRTMGTVTGTIVYGGTESALCYDGVAAIVTTNGEFPTTNGPYNLTINNAAGVTLHESRSLNENNTDESGILTLTNGKFILGNYNLTITNRRDAAIVGGSSTSFVETNGTGALIRTMQNSSGFTFNYPVGNATNYTPASFVFTANSLNNRTLAVRCIATTHPNMLTNANYIANRYWVTNLSDPSGTYAYTSAFNFIAGDEVGLTSEMRLSRWFGGTWGSISGSSVSSTTIGSGSLTESFGGLASAEWAARTARTPITFTWTNVADGSWATAANWSPTGGAPTNGDAVIFNHSGTRIITNMPTGITLTSIACSNGNTHLKTATTGALGVSGTFNVAAGSRFVLDGDITIILKIATGGTGLVNGLVRVEGDVSNTANHTIEASDLGGLVFENGSKFEAGVLNTTNFNGNPFGNSGTNGTIVFENGSVFEQFDGSHPFGLNHPNSKVVFKTGSLYKFSNTASLTVPSLSGRTYANFEYNVNATKSPEAGTNEYHINNLIISKGSFNINLAVNGNIKGHLEVADGSSLGFSPSSAKTITLNGSAPQNITLNGTGSLVLGTNATMAIANGSHANVVAESAITGTGIFSVNSGSTLGIASANGITTSPTALGNILTTTRNFGNGATYVYNGTSNQVTGNGLPVNTSYSPSGTENAKGPVTCFLTIDNSGPATNNTVSLSTTNTAVDALNLNSGFFAVGTGQTIKITDLGVITSGGGNTASGNNAGTIFCWDKVTINGTPNLYNVTVEGDANVEAGSEDGTNFVNNATITNTLQINQQGNITGNAPRYANGSTLIYNSGGIYKRNIEWGNLPEANNPGYPHHVLVQNGTTVNLGINTPLALAISGNLGIGKSSNNCIVDMNATAFDLEILGDLQIGSAPNTNSALVLSTTIGGDLHLSGNYTRYKNNFYTDNERAIFFKGTANTSVNTPGETITAGVPTQYFSYAIMDKTGEVALNCPIGIDHILTMTGGWINTNTTNNLLMVAGSTVSGGSNISFVNGPMLYQTSGTTTDHYFPVGKRSTGQFKPILFRPITDGGSRFQGEYWPQIPPTLVTPTPNVFLNNLQAIVNTEYWQLDRQTNNTTGIIRLPYVPPGLNNWRTVGYTSTNPCEPPHCPVAVVQLSNESTNPSWSFTGNNYYYSAYLPYPEYWANNEAQTISSQEISSFSPFTFGFSLEAILPVKLLSFSGNITNGNGFLQWKIADAADLAGFELQYSTDGRNFNNLATQKPNGLHYSHTHFSLKPGSHYYRLQMLEINGKRKMSEVVKLQVGGNKTKVLGMHPTLVNENVVLNVQSENNQAATLRLVDVLGRVKQAFNWRLFTGNNQYNFNAKGFTPGIYFLQINTDDGLSETLRFVKQ